MIDSEGHTTVNPRIFDRLRTPGGLRLKTAKTLQAVANHTSKYVSALKFRASGS